MILGENVNGKNLNGQVVEYSRKDVPVGTCFLDSVSLSVIPGMGPLTKKTTRGKLPKPDTRFARNTRG
jgi:hypothetical protein